ncbi:MAG: alpha/beta hydrolase [Actinomycetota bacterium]
MARKDMREIGERLREVPFAPRRARILALADAYSPDLSRISMDILGARPDDPRPYPGSFEKVVFPSLDDTPLVGVLGLHRDGGKRPGVVFCHGFHGSKNKNYIMEAALKAFEEWDYNVLSLDLRDFGESRDLSHAPSTGGWKEGQDILGACRFLGRMEEVTTVAAVGYSLGASAVLNAAFQNDLNPYITGGALAWSGFASMEAIISRFSRRPPMGDPFFPYYAVFVFLTEMRRLEMRRRGCGEEVLASLGNRPFSPDFRRYVREVVAPHYGKSEEAIYALSSPRNFVAHLEHPVLLVHAEDDPVCPVEEMEALRRASRGNPNLDIWVLPTGSHCAFMGFDEDWYWSVMRGFLDYWAERDVEKMSDRDRRNW